MLSMCLPENISYFQISQVVLEPIELWLRLELVNPIEQENFALEFRDLAYFSISKTPEDNEGCYMIGDIKLSSVNDVAPLLDKLGYGFLKLDVSTRDNFYYLHIEGDLCLDVVSCSYKGKMGT